MNLVPEEESDTMGLLSFRALSELLRQALVNWVVTGTVVSLSFVAINVVLSLRTWTRLRHIKGPPIAGFTNLWMIRTIMEGNSHWVLSQAAEKYGKFSRAELVPSPYSLGL